MSRWAFAYEQRAEARGRGVRNCACVWRCWDFAYEQRAVRAHAFGVGHLPMSEGGACVRMNVALGLRL